MTLEQLVTFNAVLIVAILSPGPAFLVALRMTLARGRRAGLMTGAGLAGTTVALVAETRGATRRIATPGALLAVRPAG